MVRTCTLKCDQTRTFPLERSIPTYRATARVSITSQASRATEHTGSVFGPLKFWTVCNVRFAALTRATVGEAGASTDMLHLGIRQGLLVTYPPFTRMRRAALEVLRVNHRWEFGVNGKRDDDNTQTHHFTRHKAIHDAGLYSGFREHHALDIRRMWS